MVTTLRPAESDEAITSLFGEPTEITRTEPEVVLQTKEEFINQTYTDLIHTQKECANKLIENIRSDIDTDVRYAEAKSLLAAAVSKLTQLRLQLGTEIKEVEENRSSKAEYAILAEVSTQLALEQAGFEIVESTPEEDRFGGIDFYAKMPEKYGEGMVMAVQVKAKQGLETVEVLDPKKPESAAISLSALQYEDVIHSEAKMVSYFKNQRDKVYTQHPEFEDHYVFPCLILVPSEGVNARFKRTGEPVPQFAKQLEEDISKTFPQKSKKA